jgi:hypothetical protein
MSVEDWNREFSELVWRGMGEPGDIAPGVSEQTVANDTATSDTDSDQAIAARRSSIAATLVRLGFIAVNRATPDNPAVAVLSELLPADAEVGLCMTCHEFSSSTPYPFAETTGIFPDVGSLRRNPSGAQVWSHGVPLLTTRRREFVVCTSAGLSWTASRVRSAREDTVTLYSAPFGEILGATVRNRHKGVVEVWVEDGPTLSFRVTPETADALQGYVDQAAQQQ